MYCYFFFKEKRKSGINIQHFSLQSTSFLIKVVAQRVVQKKYHWIKRKKTSVKLHVKCFHQNELTELSSEAEDREILPSEEAVKPLQGFTVGKKRLINWFTWFPSRLLLTLASITFFYVCLWGILWKCSILAACCISNTLTSNARNRGNKHTYTNTCRHAHIHTPHHPINGA